MNTPFYFDHNATTPVAPEVLEAMVSVMAEVYGNASSIHRTGQVARQRLESARRQLAAFLGCDSKEIVFTSGGTEADNLAILGAVRSSQRARKHVVTTAIEHAAVLNTCAYLEREGVEVTYVPVGADGVVDPSDVKRALRPDTVLISVMHANNETGAIQPIAEIARIGREAKIPVHCDGVQAAGKVEAKPRELGVDFYSISGHKLYAPKGIGALYVRAGAQLEPLLHGGRHEQGRRAGTENVAGAVALGCAAELAQSRFESEARRLSELRDRLERGIAAAVPHVRIVAGQSPRVPNTVNVVFDGVEGEAMVIALDLRGFAVSTGSACSSGAVEPSHVLMAMGMSRKEARSALRFSLGHDNNAEQVDALIEAVAECASHLRKLSPDYAHA